MLFLYRAGAALLTLMRQEWSFQYFEDTWNDPTISGIIRCAPKQMSGRRLGFPQSLVDSRVDQFQPFSGLIVSMVVLHTMRTSTHRGNRTPH